jgi:hypothetical protein
MQLYYQHLRLILLVDYAIEQTSFFVSNKVMN